MHRLPVLLGTGDQSAGITAQPSGKEPYDFRDQHPRLCQSLLRVEGPERPPCPLPVSLPWAPAWMANWPSAGHLHCDMGFQEACRYCPLCCNTGGCMPADESGPHRPGRPPTSSTGCKIMYLSASRPWNAWASVAPRPCSGCPNQPESPAEASEKRPDGHL